MAGDAHLHDLVEPLVASPLLDQSVNVLAVLLDADFAVPRRDGRRLLQVVDCPLVAAESPQRARACAVRAEGGRGRSARNGARDGMRRCGGEIRRAYLRVEEPGHLEPGVDADVSLVRYPEPLVHFRDGSVQHPHA